MDWELAGKSIFWGVGLWAACLIFLLPLKRKTHFGLRIVLSGAGIILLAGCIQYLAGKFWPGDVRMLAAALAADYLAAALGFWACVEVRGFEMWYCGVWGTMTCMFFFGAGEVLEAALRPVLGTAGTALTVAAAAGGYAAAGATAARWMPEKKHYQIGPRQMLSAWVLCVTSATLRIFAAAEPEFGPLSVMVQFYCITILYLQSALFKKSSMRKELETIQILWHQQKDHYRLSKETIDLINRKCHDLKHQVRAIRAIQNEEEREKHLAEIETSVQIYSSIVRTGNEILDTILTEKSLVCENSGIHINSVADGSLLGFMDPVDLYTFFGNALDNAIEAVRKLGSREKRVIDIMCYERQNFLVIQIVNPVSGELKFEDGLPLTTKAKNGYHGYGMKSIRHTIRKYGGYLLSEVKNGCFYLKVMIPLQMRRTEE